MTVEYVYCEHCKHTTRHIRWAYADDWECSKCKGRKNTTGQHKPITVKGDQKE